MLYFQFSHFLNSSHISNLYPDFEWPVDGSVYAREESRYWGGWCPVLGYTAVLHSLGLFLCQPWTINYHPYRMIHLLTIIFFKPLTFTWLSNKSRWKTSQSMTRTNWVYAKSAEHIAEAHWLRTYREINTEKPGCGRTTAENVMRHSFNQPDTQCLCCIYVCMWDLIIRWNTTKGTK